MAKYSNQVTYDIKTTLDASGITKLQSELAKVQSTLNSLKGKKDFKLGLNVDELEGYRAEIEQLSRVLSTTFNTRTGMLDLNKFNTALNNGTINAERLGAAFNAAGHQGKIAFNSLVTSITTLNKNAITANSTLSKIANTFGNTVRWGITASIFQQMMSSVQGAVSYMKDLDESLTNIQMVTNSSKEDMRELAQYANNAAQALGSTTVDYTNAVKVFVQEGFSESESKQYANLSTKLANVSEQSTAVTSDQITAYRNAFQLDYQQTVEAMDKVANVANNTASNVNELMTASQRAASVAQAVGSSQDSFLAAIATIESVTRQSAEEIGNGLKTIYQRFADIKVSGSTDDGVDYGQYAKALQQVGVDVLDVSGQFKGMDQILKELQDVWSELDDTMKIAVGEKVAGKFQYNRFAALMNNPEYYQKALGATQGASGMMDQMNEYYIEGIEGRLNTLRAAGEQVISTLFDQDNIEPVIEAATDFLNIINTIIDTVGGGVPVFTALSAVILKMFSAQIGEQAARIATNISTMMQGGQNVKQMQATLTGLQASGIAVNTDTYKYAKSSVGSMVGLSSNTQQEWSNTVAKSAEIEEQLLLSEIKFEETVGLANAKLEARYKTSTHIKDIEASKTTAIKNEAKALQEIENILKAELVLDEELFAVDENLLRQKVAIQKALADSKILTNEEVLEEAKKVELLGADRAIVEEILKAERERQAAQQQHNAQLEVQKQLDERMLMEQQGKSITNLVSGLTSVVFLAQSAVSIWQTWTDENTSFEDKVVGSLMSLAMILPMVTTAWQALTAVKIADLKATIAQTAASVASVAAQGLLTLAVAAESAGFVGLSEAIFAASVALEATPVGWILTAIMAIVAVIASAVIAFNTWQESIHAANKEFEAQRELLNKTKKNYSEAREEVDALKQSIDAIGETKTSLEDLTKGTDEWREAVRKLNDQVLTLLQTYPELAQYVTNEDGVLNISDTGMNQFYQKQLDEADHLASVNSVQQINTLQAQNKKYIEDFSNQWGLSKEEISSAIEKGAYSLEGKSDQLNASFAELVNKVQVNSTSVDNLSDNIGTLNTTYSDYSSKEDINLDEVKETIREQYGVTQYDEYGNSTGIKLDFSTMTGDQEFLDAVAEATGKNIIGATDTSWFDGNVKFKTNDGDEFEYTTDQLLNLLADSQAAIDATNRKLEENKIIYEAFGARYDETSKKFIDSSGETVSSLENLNGVTSDEIAAIKAFQDGIYNDIAIKDFYGSLEEFVTGLKNGTLSVDGFSEALLATQVQRKEEGIFGDEGRLTSLSQTKGVIVDTNADGVTESLKLSPEQARAIMTDMMKKLNESNLSDEEKLQLMDKIDWNMPVQDILANIQHAIDTGNINSAFIDTIGLEDDSERKSKVLEDYNIDESTLGAYTEQLQTTEELAKQHEKLADSLKYAKEQFGDESDEAKNARKALAAFNDESEDMAVDLAQTQKGLESLSDNMAEYGDILKNGDKTTLEYAEALGKVKKSLADTLNISEENLSNSLIQNNLEDIEALAAGDEEALNRLRAAAGQDIVAGFYVSEDSTLTEEHMEYLKQKAIEVSSLNIEVGADVNDEEFVNTLNNMIANGELTKDQVNEYLHGIGVEPHFETDTIDTDIFNTAGMYVRIPLPWGGNWDIQIPSFALRGQVQVPKITAGEGSTGGTGLRRTASPSAPSGHSGISPSYVNDTYKPKGGGGGGNKGSGSNKDTKPKDKDKTEWDYLTDITNDLDRAAAAMEKLAKLEDRLYGANRISQIKKLQSEYKNYIKLLEQEVNLAKDHAQLLRTNAYDENGNLTVNGYAYRAGFNQVNFDAQGNLENGKAIEAALVNIVNARIDEYNAHRNDDDASYYEERVQLAQQDHEGFLKALSEYESTLGKIEEGQSEIQDYKEKIQDAADSIVDAIQEGIDDITEAIDSQRDFNKLYRDWTQGGSGYSHFDNQRRYYAEGLAGILSPTVDGGMSIFDMQLQSLQGRINDALDVIDGDSQDADDEKLSEQAAFENLQEATGAIMDNLNNIIDYYNSLLETIEEASSKMDELIDGRLESFDHLEDYLDTRLDQLKLLFGERSYEQQVQFYNQKIAVNTEKLASIGTAIEAKQATVKALEELEATGKELSTEEREVLKNARDEVTSLQEKQLDTETQLLQDIADRLNSQLNAELDVTVSNLFGGEDIDWLSQQWELATRNSEQYLDDYNRSFELEKLQLKYQQLLNDTQDTSLITQQRITEKMNEQLKYLREKKGLTEYDVQYAEKQLEILQRRIALEDAQSNKSQMRLQRNAAGNYDFVYGADEDAVNQAAQALLASQQEAYNLSKEIYKQTYESALRAAKEIKQMIIDTAMDASLTTEQQTERIKWLMDNLGEYLSNSSIELGEISVNLYNDIAGAEQLISEENLGHLAETFELMREQSTYTTEFVKEGLAETSSNIENSSAATFDSIQNQFGATKDSINGNLKDIELSVTNALGASSKVALGTLETIKQGTIDTTKGEKGIQGIIADVIGGIDENFNLSKENTLASVKEIDEGINKAYNNISGEDGYLEKYRNKTEETLDSAGDSYDSFTENSLNYTTEQLGILIETTDVWKEDLDTLNSVINDSAGELKEWKGKGDAAIESAKKLITESNNIQISFGNLAVSSAITSDTLYGFGDAAREAGYAVASMSNEIRDAYYSMQQAANAAAAAYQDMINTANNAAYAANNATQAAINAQNAMNNAGLYTTISSTASNIANNFKNKVSSGLSSIFNRKNNSGGDWYWDGYTYQYYGGYDTGGYTGSWSDKGVDDKSGKWAILHQKELVLNADDTKNMLSAVELVRDIMSGLKSTNSSFGKAISQNNLADTIQQRVEINATFPGVTTALEIERALTELADNAYQYSNRYKY